MQNRILNSHRKQISDRQNCDFDSELANQGHVGKESRIAGIVQPMTCNLNYVATWVPSVTTIGQLRRVMGDRHFDSEITAREPSS